MQGEYPLPERVIEQFSKTNGELCENVFLLGAAGLFLPLPAVLLKFWTQASRQW